MGAHAIVAMTAIDERVKKKMQKHPERLPETLYFYRHWGGYPDSPDNGGVEESLGKFCRWLKEGVIRNNLYQTPAWLVIAGREEWWKNQSAIAARDIPCPHVFSPYEDVSYDPNKEKVSSNHLWRVGHYDIAGSSTPGLMEYEPLSYIHVVDVFTGTWFPVPWVDAPEKDMSYSSEYKDVQLANALLKEQVGELPIPGKNDSREVLCRKIDKVVATVACALASEQLKPWVEWEFAITDRYGKRKGEYFSRPYFLSEDMRRCDGNTALPKSRLMVRRTVRGKSQYHLGVARHCRAEGTETWSDSEEAAIKALEIQGAPDSRKEDIAHDSPAP